MPLVSIIIPTHNRLPLLPQAIESVLAQDMRDLELIVVDDGSTDGTGDVLARYQEEARVRSVRQDNGGRSRARNHGARLATGEWLGFLDSDDRYLPKALSRHLAVIGQQPETGLTLGGHTNCDAAGQTLGERRPWEEGSLTLTHWLFNCLGMPGTLLVRRDWFEKLGGFDPACEIAEDWDFFLRLARAGCPMQWVRQPVCVYRLHAGNSVAAPAAHHRGSLHTLDKFFRAGALPPELAALEPCARGWAHVVFAKRAWAGGDGEAARRSLDEALRLDPTLGTARRLEVLEALLAPMNSQSAAAPPAALLAAQLPPALAAHPGELRRAQARVEMAQFFRGLRGGSAGWTQAAAHLRAGLRHDPTWLFNRGVIAFGLRYGLRRITRA